MQPIVIIGIGDDGPDSLAAPARAALDGAGMIVGGARHLAMLPDGDPRPKMTWSKDLGADIEAIDTHRRAHAVAVLASGDPMQFGIATRLIERFGIDAIRVHPAPGAFSMAAARLGWSLGDPLVRCVSLHAFPESAIRRDVQPGRRLLILSRDGSTPAAVSNILSQMGYGQSPVSVLEHLGGAEERRTDGIAADLSGQTFAGLNTLAVTCVAGATARRLSRVPGLADDAFDHDGTITKREVRAITLAALGPMPGDVLWDVGAGNGTIAIEWLRAEVSATAIAFERDPVRAGRIRNNADRLGVPALGVIEGDVAETLAGVPGDADAIFIGGGIAEHARLIETCLGRLRPHGRLVANAVTLEAQSALLAARQKHGGELLRIGIAEAAPVGSMSALKPAIDVLQWRITKP